MQESFLTQPQSLVPTADFEHAVFHSFDDTEALIDWPQIENLLPNPYIVIRVMAL